MQIRTLAWAYALLVSALAFSTHAAAQTGVPLSGKLVDSLTRAPIAGATVVIEELRRETKSDQEGLFTFADVPPGSYHVAVRFEGFSSRRSEVAVTATGASVELLIEPELHYQDVVSVGPERRSQFEAYQPTTVLAGQELTKQLEMSVGETLQHQPGVAARSFGPAPSRPVIRGLDGDRVLILQDGQRTGDLSSQSGDHGVTVNPAAAQRIEVVRGPATLLYGANAIGGLVNVITDEIPTSPERGVGGNLTFDLGTAAGQGAAAGDVHVGTGKVALHIGGGGRRSGDVGTPLGEVENSQSRSG